MVHRDTKEKKETFSFIVSPTNYLKRNFWRFSANLHWQKIAKMYKGSVCVCRTWFPLRPEVFLSNPRMTCITSSQWVTLVVVWVHMAWCILVWGPAGLPKGNVRLRAGLVVAMPPTWERDSSCESSLVLVVAPVWTLCLWRLVVPTWFFFVVIFSVMLGLLAWVLQA